MQAYLIFAVNDKQMKEKDSTCDRLTDFRPWRSCTTQGEQARSNAGRFLGDYSTRRECVTGKIRRERLAWCTHVDVARSP
jgi:hypothetical protein